jgi:3',5'-cyclic AMP phosphodiesterase CpdA
VGGLVPIFAVWVGVTYRRQITSYLTHWKGSPTSTVPYRTYSPAPALHLAVAGDTGDSGSRLRRTAAAMAALDAEDDFDALLLLGDNVYPSGDPARLRSTVFEPFADVLDGDTRLLAILGNHDVMKGHGQAQLDALGMPGRWWSERLGDVLIVGLDSNDIHDPDQRAFLEAELAGTDATWKVILVHHPPYSAGYQGSNADSRQVVAPIAARYGVQLVLSGHDHDYQRSKPIDGVTYVVTGGAAGTRRTGEKDFTAVSFSWPRRRPRSHCTTSSSAVMWSARSWSSSRQIRRRGRK